MTPPQEAPVFRRIRRIDPRNRRRRTRMKALIDTYLANR